MLTNKDYCDYETCVALKELGFNNVTEARLSISAKVFDLKPEPYIEQSPKILLYEAQKWLREEKKIGVFISGFKNGYTFWINNLLNGDTLYQGFFDNETGKKYQSYEEALSEGIKEAVKILKEK